MVDYVGHIQKETLMNKLKIPALMPRRRQGPLGRLPRWHYSHDDIL